MKAFRVIDRWPRRAGVAKTALGALLLALGSQILAAHPLIAPLHSTSQILVLQPEESYAAWIGISADNNMCLKNLQARVTEAHLKDKQEPGSATSRRPSSFPRPVLAPRSSSPCRPLLQNACRGPTT